MKDVSWDDLRVFFHVATCGGLTGAAKSTGLSPATIGRRMLSLEQASGQALFKRSQTGYSLTPAGDALLVRVRSMHAAAVPVGSWLQSTADTPVLRLSAGTATATFLADRFMELIQPGDGFRLNFVATEAILDIAHREIDLGIRNRPAEAGNLASRKLQMIRFAPYRSYSAGSDRLDWVAMDPTHARHPAAHWVLRQGHPVAAYANSVAMVHQLVRAGTGKGVMPCMIGDLDPSLVRAGPLIDELTETQYMVMHADDRHRPELRRLIERIVGLYRDSADLLAGERPLRVTRP